MLAPRFGLSVAAPSEAAAHPHHEKSVCAKFARTASDGKIYQVDYFNLDAVLSVGYRVNSKRGTQFRIWATRTLRSHLVRGFSLHERRLRERSVDFEQALALLARTLTSNSLVTDEGRDVLDVVRRYTRTWRLLLEYDENRLARTPELPTAVSVSISVDAARAAITNLREVSPAQNLTRTPTDHVS